MSTLVLWTARQCSRGRLSRLCVRYISWWIVWEALPSRTPAQAASVRQGATRVIEERRLQALRRLYMRFTGDVSRLAVLCQRIAETEDILHAFSAPPSRPALDCTSLGERIRRRLGEAITSCEGAVFFQLMRHVDPIPGAGCLADFGLDACLPRSLRDQSWPRSVAVAIPSSFDVEHLSGIQVLDLLAVCNPHDRDAYLSFEPREHVYAWQGRRIGLSVTGLVHSLVQTFEPRDALLAMRKRSELAATRVRYTEHGVRVEKAHACK